MQKATAGVQRILSRLRVDRTRRRAIDPPGPSFRRRGLAFARALRGRIAPLASHARLFAHHTEPVEAPRVRAPGPRQHPPGAHHAKPAELLVVGRTRALTRTRRRAVTRLPFVGLALLGREHVLPMGVAGLVAIAAIASFTPGPAATFGTGNTTAGGTTPRILVGGDNGAGVGAVDPPLNTGPTNIGAIFGEGPDPATSPTGPYLSDGTLVMPVAVNTSVADGSGKLTSYRVRSGDTLTGIAHHFGVSMMSVWWANNLKSKDDLHIGQTLQIPPVSGLVITVADGDTLDSLAARTGVGADDIYVYNGLTDRHLVLGQTIIIPGAIGAGIPVAKAAPSTVTHSSGGGGSTYRPPPTSYGGGNLAWPVPGGYISQYFHYGHEAIDIAAPYGSRIIAAASGTVVFAGYNSNGGGYQVWVSHGSGLYTTYNHLSSIAVGRGESVGRGDIVGRVGTSGWATGPHCHFEVWRGFPWDGGSYRVNPLAYL